MFAQTADNTLLNVSPSVLIDMKGGGNVRRKRRNYESFLNSVKNKGIIQPVIARVIDNDPNNLELLAGYGRRSAAIDANLQTMPVLVRHVSDREALEIHLSENIDREDLTLTDEVNFAKRYISLHNGDRHSAAKALGWEVTRLSSRLELLTCIPEVLDNLDDGIIKAGHALILAVFNPTIQANTLKKVIAEKWSVKELSLKANQAQIPLSKARFDLSECNTCMHNTSRQSGLFDLGETEAKCSNNKCYQQKNAAFMEVQREAAEERFGKVLYLSQSNKEDRNTVSASAVGEAQFNEGCDGCSNRIAVMDDRITESAGRILPDQCIDTDCFKKCTKAFQKSIAATSNDGSNQSLGNVQNQDFKNSETKASNSTTSKPKKVVSATVPAAAIENHKVELREFAGAHVENNQIFSLALQVVSLISFTNFKLMTSPEKTMQELMQKNEDELNRMIKSIVAFSAREAKSFGTHQPNASKFLSHAACATTDGVSKLTTLWKPTQANLEKYVTTQIIHLCKLSGFAEAMNTQKLKSFDSLAKGNKAAVIKGILAHKFDWSGFAPNAYIALLPIQNSSKS